jgi:hypothetical protein
MGDYLTLYRLLTGRFCNACKRLKSSQPVLRLVQVEICREVIALFLIATALAVSGDVESNPGPNNRNCEACGNKDSPGLAYFSFPLNRLV